NGLIKCSTAASSGRFPNYSGDVRCPKASGQTAACFAPASFIAPKAPLRGLAKGKTTETHDGPCHYAAPVHPNSDEHVSVLVRDPDQPENSKILKVAIIGAPNAGKSSLSNQIIGRKVFAVSKKVHTTRSRAQGLLIEDAAQIVILDTPGLTTPSKAKRHRLEKSLLVDPSSSVHEADLVLVVVDVSDKWARSKLGFEVLKCLACNPDIPAVLVLNKVDLVKEKTTLLDITAGLTEGIVNGKKLQVRPTVRAPSELRSGTPEVEPAREQVDGVPASGLSRTSKGQLGVEELRRLRTRQGWPHFQDVFMLSAIVSEEVEALKRYLVMGAKPGSWQFHSGVLTDQSPEEMCTNAIREKLLEYLPQEVPYNISQTIEMWHETEAGELDIIVKLCVRKENYMKMLIGQGGHMIARIAHEAADDLMDVFQRVVKLKLSVKMEKVKK
ncbi:GTPase Era, mitochondrial, partial [Brienomyrus brachyistius]|uniref:GTPase Era, mitochondrial n=1 Tax=Brienomyrus brachyistius TaxID=42636 RepID=UPI0020B33BD9